MNLLSLNVLVSGLVVAHALPSLAALPGGAASEDLSKTPASFLAAVLDFFIQQESLS
jgi:hypothetical protein